MSEMVGEEGDEGGGEVVGVIEKVKEEGGREREKGGGGGERERSDEVCIVVKSDVREGEGDMMADVEGVGIGDGAVRTVMVGVWV